MRKFNQIAPSHSLAKKCFLHSLVRFIRFSLSFLSFVRVMGSKNESAPSCKIGRRAALWPRRPVGPVWLSDGEQRWAFTVRFSRLIHECIYAAWNARDGARWQWRIAGCLLTTIGTWAISAWRSPIVGESGFWMQLWWSFAFTTRHPVFLKLGHEDEIDPAKWICHVKRRKFGQHSTAVANKPWLYLFIGLF